MENKDRKTDYQEVVRAGNQKWQMVEITVRIFFFVSHSYSLFFVFTGNFQVLPQKNHPHPKCQFPPKIQVLPKFLLYKPPEKLLNPLPPSLSEDANFEIPLDRSMYSFFVIKM